MSPGAPSGRASARTSRSPAISSPSSTPTPYVLDGLSAWTGAHREQLRQALDGARRGEYDVLLCWALDRLERGGIEPTLRVMRQVRDASVQVISLQEPWTGAGGEMQELLTAIIAWVARMESQRRSERVRAGLARRKAYGLPVGRQPGATDRRPRERSGYYAEQERRRDARSARMSA